jgi:cyclophilin family peptidyl-prolyl cis-trans isomerase
VLGGVGVLVALAALVLVLVSVRDGGNDARVTSGGGGPGPEIGEHWHATLGINVCGQWQPAIPAFESATGIHSHGDGFVHIHPFSNAGAGRNATLGLFLGHAGVVVTNTSLNVDSQRFKDGDECPGLGPGRLRWSVDGDEQAGDPQDHVFTDTEVLALAFLPDGTEIGTPPAAASGGPSDVAPGAGGPTDPPATAPPSADSKLAGTTCDDRKAVPAPNPRTYPAPPPMTIDPAKKYTASFDTSCGTLVVDLEAGNAPTAVNNFVFLAQENFYDGLTWHRLVKNFVIQGGDPRGDGTGGPGYDVAGESPKDGYKIGSLAAAKSGDQPAGTMGSQFFIVTGPCGTHLPNEYARFGMVTGGGEVAQKLQSFAGPDESPSRPLYIFDIAITES